MPYLFLDEYEIFKRYLYVKQAYLVEKMNQRNVMIRTFGDGLQRTLLPSSSFFSALIVT